MGWLIDWYPISPSIHDLNFDGEGMGEVPSNQCRLDWDWDWMGLVVSWFDLIWFDLIWFDLCYLPRTTMENGRGGGPTGPRYDWLIDGWMDRRIDPRVFQISSMQLNTPSLLFCWRGETVILWDGEWMDGWMDVLSWSEWVSVDRWMDGRGKQGREREGK